MEIRSNLLTILNEKDITIRQLSKNIDYRYETVRSLCHNQIERLPLDLLAKICVYLDIRIEDILTLEKNV
ncbi:helix-turn-helix transcriptional regulator [Paenibacillus sp. FSL R10-2782]|uniref:helix-turn-helix domain-containing protein n=1 Tax=Paenibacillus sp. FSL R10-2782 TaxID=2954661 RepID=UPI003158B647